MKRIAVIDIGKTNAKLALVDPECRAELAVVTTPNKVLSEPPYPHFDTAGLWAFLKAGLRDLGARHGIDGISITTHGACAALLDAAGDLAAPVLDYEHDGPDSLRDAYDALRPDFALTGSPRLPMGLNLGAQLHWLLARDPALAQRVATVVTWPQYWAHQLTGAVACDLCSLGCHTDLWNPVAGTWSSLPHSLGLSGKMAPPRKPGDVLGMLRPELQAELGLGAIPVLVGIHDSNASLFPHLLNREAPFSVVSTGTWVIAMAVGGAPVTVDPQRDTLMNVSALGQAVPSARFMGGREFEILRQGRKSDPTEADARAVLDRRLMVLPAIVADSGPFAQLRLGWREAPRSDAEAEVAISYYLALVTAECLSLVGAAGPTVIEGPFAANGFYRAMLSAATGRPVTATASRTGTAIGAALLFSAVGHGAVSGPVDMPDPALLDYVRDWRAAVEA